MGSHDPYMDKEVWQGALESYLSDARSLGSVTFTATDEFDRQVLHYFADKVSCKNMIDDVFVTQGWGTMLFTSADPTVIKSAEPQDPPLTEEACKWVLDSFLCDARSEGSLSYTAEDDLERQVLKKFKEYVSPEGLVDNVRLIFNDDTILFKVEPPPALDPLLEPDMCQWALDSFLKEARTTRSTTFTASDDFERHVLHYIEGQIPPSGLIDNVQVSSNGNTVCFLYSDMDPVDPVGFGDPSSIPPRPAGFIPDDSPYPGDTEMISDLKLMIAEANKGVIIYIPQSDTYSAHFCFFIWDYLSDRRNHPPGLRFRADHYGHWIFKSSISTQEAFDSLVRDGRLVPGDFPRSPGTIKQGSIFSFDFQDDISAKICRASVQHDAFDGQ